MVDTNVISRPSSAKDRAISFIWQHILLLISLFVMTLGVAMCVRSALGSSVISSIPYVLTLAGADARVPALSIGEYTYLMNAVLVLFQILILRRRFHLVQLFQLIIGFAFGLLLDLNMWLTAPFIPESLTSKILLQFLGCTILGFGISMEILCGSVTMPGEGITVATSQATGLPFPKCKIYIDTTLVVIAVILGYIYFGHWLWNVVGPGTLFAMIYVEPSSASSPPTWPGSPASSPTAPASAATSSASPVSSPAPEHYLLFPSLSARQASPTPPP